MFWERPIGSEKNFSSTDLIKFVESLIRSCKMEEMRKLDRSNYSWLKSRNVGFISLDCELDEFKPVIGKLSSENCANVAVKLQMLTEDTQTPIKTAQILREFKKLLEEEHSMSLIDENVRRAKGRGRKKQQNKVHPELTPPGRQPTVSFILN